MLSSFVWLSPSVAPAVLKSSSNLLKGEVPSPSDRLASCLKASDGASCEGALKDAGLRMALAGGLKAVGEISDGAAGALVEAFGGVLEAQVKEIRAKAAKLEKALPKKAMPSFSEVVATLPKGEQPGQALRTDWILWQAMGHGYDAKALPALTEKVLRDRIAVAACAGEGPAADCALALQILENVDAYIAWELSIPGSHVPKKSNEVVQPFAEKQTKEAATRRVLMHAGLPAEVASQVATKAVLGMDVAQTLKELAAEAKKAAVLPMYVAPVAAKEPMKKGEGKADKADADGGKREGGKKDKGGAAPAKGGAVVVPAGAGALGSFYAATATQELQWALLAYQIRPRTSLSAAAGGSSGGVASNGVVAERPQGFAGTWAPMGDGMPPGHTQYSWNHAKVAGMSEAVFATTWTPEGAGMSPGHTPYSWEKVLGATGASAPASSSKAAAPAAAPKAEKAAAAAAAPAAAQPKAVAPGGADDAAEGSDEAALTKLDIRCGRIMECGRVPDADSLYLLKIDIGEAQPRQVVSSLVKHYKEEELKDRQVVVYCNIKPGKMRGFESQAMVLAATQDKGAENEKCELLLPPKGCKEGTRVQSGATQVGSASEGVSTKNISKVWGQVQPLLQMNDKKEATFKGTTWTFPEGAITSGLTGCGIY